MPPFKQHLGWCDSVWTAPNTVSLAVMSWSRQPADNWGETYCNKWLLHSTGGLSIWPSVDRGACSVNTPYGMSTCVRHGSNLFLSFPFFSPAKLIFWNTVIVSEAKCHRDLFGLHNNLHVDWNVYNWPTESTTQSNNYVQVAGLLAGKFPG